MVGERSKGNKESKESRESKESEGNKKSKENKKKKIGGLAIDLKNLGRGMSKSGSEGEILSTILLSSLVIDFNQVGGDG